MLILGKAVQIAEVIVRSQQAGTGYRAPLYQAAAAGLISIVECGRSGRVPSRVLKASPMPLLVCLGDDDDMPSGPVGWPQAPKLLRWARGVILHGAGGEAKHYAAAVAMTALAGRTLLIETNTANLPAWRGMVNARKPAVPSLVIVVPPDRPAHPTHTGTHTGSTDVVLQ